MLLTFPLLDAAALAQARALLAHGDWADGRASAGDQAARVKKNLQLAPRSDVAQQLQALVLRALDASPQFLAAALPRRVLPPRFNRYTVTHSHYGAHVDGAIRIAPDGARLRTDLSCTVFLNEPHAYDGGELVIQGAPAVQRVKLAAGHAVLYDATQVHEVTPVTRGERLASFFWVESLVRCAQQRALLWQMDQALVALRTRDGESAEAVALTGTYHNLLRMWAQT